MVPPDARRPTRTEAATSRPPLIRAIQLQRFRSIQHDRIVLANPTILVGRNGSGKSNFVDAFSFLAECMTMPLHAVFARRGNIGSVRNRSSGQSHPPNLGMRVEFGSLNGLGSGGCYAFEVRARPSHAYEVKEELCRLRSGGPETFFHRKGLELSGSDGLPKLELDAAALALPLIGGDQRFAPIVRTLGAMRVYSIQPEKVRQFQDADAGTVLRSDGSNAASVLQEIQRTAPEDAKRLGQILETIVPSTSQVRTIRHGQQLSLEFTQQWGSKRRLKFEAFNISDGTLRAIGLLLSVFQRPAPTVLVIEEPEATIHPGAIPAILDLIRFASERAQIIVTTHSPDVLDSKWIGDEHLRIVLWEDGATRIGGLSDASASVLREHLAGAGELMRAGALETRPLFEDSSRIQHGLFE